MNEGEPVFDIVSVIIAVIEGDTVFEIVTVAVIDLEGVCV